VIVTQIVGHDDPHPLHRQGGFCRDAGKVLISNKSLKGANGIFVTGKHGANRLFSSAGSSH
jgi:hypothetical protein